MPRAAKTIALVLAALLILLLAVVAYIAFTFDPNAYKPRIVDMVKERTQRTLTIPGDIELAVFPELALEIGAASISERNGSETFASLDHAEVTLQIWPLLSGEVVADEILIEGLQATIRRDVKGVANFEDLVGGGEQQQPAQETPAQPVAFDIGGLVIRDADLLYIDEQAGRRIAVSNLVLESEGLADGTPSGLQLQAHVKSSQPAVDATVALETVFTLGLQEGLYRLEDLDLAVKGALAGISNANLALTADAVLQPSTMQYSVSDAALALTGTREGAPLELKLATPRLAVSDDSISGGKLSGEVALTQEARRIGLSFQAPSFSGTPQAFKVPQLSATAAVKGEGLDVQVNLSGTLSGNLDELAFQSPQMTLAFSGQQEGKPLKGKLTTPFEVNLAQDTFALQNLDADLSLPNPAGGTLALDARGQVTGQLEKETVSAKLTGTLDRSPFDAQITMTGFADPAYRFDIGIDRFDLDRYRAAPAAAAGGAGAAGAGKPAQAAAQGAASAPEAAEAFDLSALRDLDARGTLRIGELQAGGIKASKVRAQVQAASGKLQLEPFSANLYGGSVSGTASLQAAEVPRLALRQKLTGVNVGPLLQDAFEQDTLTGRGDVQLDITATGATVDAMLQTLQGTARVGLRDGAVRGFNIAEILRNARSRIDALRGKESVATGSGEQKQATDFSELSGSFRIKDGVAFNDDLDVKTPLLRVGGSGQVDVADKRLDYLARATVVPTLKGQGGPELEVLKGVTVPVQLQGPFSDIAWRVDVAAMAQALAGEKLEEKKAEVKARVKEQLEEEKAKLKEELKEGLRGLFR